MTCELCGGDMWVCEEHYNLPHNHDDCGGAGDPCPMCNPHAEHNFESVIVEVI